MKLVKSQSRQVCRKVLAGLAGGLMGLALLQCGTAPAAAAEFQVNTTTASSQDLPAVATDADGDFVITWQSGSFFGGSNEIYARRYNAAGVPQGGEFQVNTTTANRQELPAIAMDDTGNFVIAWMSLGQDGSSYGVYAQRYNAAGVKQGGEFQVNTTTADAQDYPAVAMNAGGDFVITWESYRQDGSGYGVYAQRYNAAGVKQGGEFQVNTTTAAPQEIPRVGMDDEGDFVITWRSYGQDGDEYGVFAQRYNAAGVKQGGEFQVNTTTAGNQQFSAVALDADGDFVISWMSDEPGDEYIGAYAQRYNAAGVKQGGEFLVSTTTYEEQSYPAVDMNDVGDFVITWSTYDQDGDSYGIYAQRYRAGGLKHGGEFQVNTYTESYQWFPAVALDDEGDFVVTWTSYDQDGDAYGVYADLFQFASATADSATVAQGSGLTVIPVLGNDKGQGLVITGSSDPAHGTTVPTGGTPGAYTGLAYQPDPTFSGMDTFTYSVRDARGAISTAVVTVTVTPATSTRNSAVIGRGTLSNNPKASVALGAWSNSWGTRGSVTYTDKLNRVQLVSTWISAVVVQGRVARVYGKGTINGRGNSNFVVTVSDFGSSATGPRDTVRIDLSNGYSAASGVIGQFTVIGGASN